MNTAMPVIKQLAYENANKYCHEAIASIEMGVEMTISGYAGTLMALF